MTRGGEGAVRSDLPGGDMYRGRRDARRAAARRYHPDLGGSSEELVAALIAIDAHFTTGRDITDGPTVFAARGGVTRRLRATLRGWYRRRRARHYFSL